jgi:N-acetylneuraminic acid mutarotase
MPTARGYLVSETVNGKIYAIGGHDGTAPTDVVEAYDPVIDTWTNCAAPPHLTNECQPMPGVRTGAASAVANGRIYVFGGGNTNAPSAGLDTVEEFDPINNAWTPKTPMSTTRSVLTADTVNGKIYVIGGNSTAPMDIVEEYDPATDTWTNCAPDPYCAPIPIGGINNHSTCVIDGKIYVAGGGFGGANLTDAVQVYDPGTNSWETRQPMPEGPRNAATGSALNRRCFIIGGGDSTGAYLARVEEYDPDTDQWSTKTSMPTSRTVAASSVANGRLYVIGGAGSGSPWTRDAVEEYSPDFCSDLDDDGFGSPGSMSCDAGPEEDCNDSDSSVYPGAEESCNGIDDDCDDLISVDELDNDADGFLACEECDDTSAAVNPDAYELPGNVIDENCDGSLGACDPTAEWRNHGQFVRCVAHEVNALIEAGLITEEEGDALVRSAAHSEVGK